jgi:hypothetical protein
VDTEVRDMVQYLVKNNKGRYFDRNEVYDPAIQAQRLRLITELR